MTETIQQCITAKKGTFIGVIQHVSELKAGTGKNGDWTMKKFTIKDPSGEIELVAWNDEIARAQTFVGKKCEFKSFWFKEYEGNTSLAFGNYGAVSIVEEVIEGVKITTKPETKEELKPIHIEKLSPISDIFKDMITQETITLLQIEQEVKQVMKTFEPHLVDAKVGMFVKEIYRESKKSNLTKASKLP